MRHKRLVVASAVAVVLSGCSSGATGSTAATSTPPVVPPPLLSAPATEACDPATLAGLEQVVTSQLEAYKARDFAAAFALSSSQFQSISSVDGLRALIDDGQHAEVLDSASHHIGECRGEGPGGAVAVVDVTGSNGASVVLAYQFVVENGQWKILMSRPMGSHGGDTPVDTGSLGA